MSPLTLRRYRAERLLRDEFEHLRGRVLAKVRGRLRARGVHLDAIDLEACYAQAWQGLYAALLAGEEIESPAGWLVVVAFRRAIEEHRAHVRAPAARSGDQAGGVGVQAEGQCSTDRDLADGLDDRIKLRHLFEGLRGSLSAREREAAVLCYLQGLTRAQAAERMGVSDARMRKLMEGRGGRGGVASKVGALVNTIRLGGWCEEQASLMRGLAYGILEPDGERHRLAVMHRSECPACRAYVLSLRGLAAALPPVFPPAGLGAAAVALAREGGRIGVGTGAAGAMRAGSGGAGSMQVGSGLGAVSATGAAGAGGAGGSWLLAGGPLGAKLAVGCMLALGVGAGCVALREGLGVSSASHRHSSAHAFDLPVVAGGRWTPDPLTGERSGSKRWSEAGSAQSRTAAPGALASGRRVDGEFGPEHGAAERLAAGAVDRGRAPTARSASMAPSAAQSGAEREFAPG